MGELFVVATPIGNLADLSERARSVLGRCPLILAEDTRHTRKLLSSIGVTSRLLSLNEHNFSGRIQTALDALSQHDVALVSDAGTPTINDPGYQLIAAAHESGVNVSISRLCTAHGRPPDVLGKGMGCQYRNYRVLRSPGSHRRHNGPHRDCGSQCDDRGLPRTHESI